MLRIGRLKIHGDGKWPRSRAEMKKGLRIFAGKLGLELRFVTRQKKNTSWCQITTGRAVICEGVGGKLYPMPEVMHHALHEISHWIQYNEGFFRKYWHRPYYKGTWWPPEKKDLRRIGLRTERHADWLARRLATELYGVQLTQGSIYDEQHTAYAKFYLKEHYSL
jgi:hypothetical protein